MTSGLKKKIAELQNKLTPVVIEIVIKKQPIEILKTILEMENQVIAVSTWQNFEDKFIRSGLINDIKKSTKLHFIGHLQTNKVKNVVKYFDIIESVDSIKLLETINKCAARSNKVQTVMLQCNISKDIQKFGFDESEIELAINTAKRMPNISIKGLMTIIEEIKDENKQFEYFEKLNKLKKKYGLEFTSMGMSNDYKQAVKAGATHVRIGSLIFDSI